MAVRQKTRGRKFRQAMFGKGQKPVKGQSKFQPLTKYLGSVLTPANTNDFKRAQIEHFKQMFEKDVVAARDKIKAQEGKTDEEILTEVEAFNEKQPNEVELHEMAVRFAIKMTSKENKHYKSYLEGKAFYEYAGQKYPVLTQAMVDQTKSIHEIIAAAQQEDGKFNTGPNEQGEPVINGFNFDAEGNNETLRSDPGFREDSEDEYRSGDEESATELLSDQGND